MSRAAWLVALALGCGPSGQVRHPPGDSAIDSEPDSDPVDSDPVDSDPVDSGPVDTGPPPRCPDDTVEVGDTCIDRYEAPNRPGALPLVMYTWVEAGAWCEARARRLCFDDEWASACSGPAGSAYPYGEAWEPGRCNDEETWRTYSQSRLNGWPGGVATPGVDDLGDLLDAVRAAGAGDTADHVQELYQGEGSGDNAGCGGAYGVFDLTGNVEEWTTRRDGGTADFHGNLKGRYWAETRTCHSNLTSHGDYFRFYEIGFRCCMDAR